MKHIFGFTSLVSVHTPAEMCEAAEKNEVSDKFYLYKTDVPRTPSSLGDFIATSGTHRAGCELCVGFSRI